ncbi:acyl-CoA N-acyltransferase, partial [Atractiella rhizophila]
SPSVDSLIFKHCLAIRVKVFVDEQKFTYESEDDGLDVDCHHFLLLSLPSSLSSASSSELLERLEKEDEAVKSIGALRQFVKKKPGKVARVAILPEGRGKGLGGLLVSKVVEWERENGKVKELFLHSQYLPKTIRFYERLGFKSDGSPIFMEDGMEHIKLVLPL